MGQAVRVFRPELVSLEPQDAPPAATAALTYGSFATTMPLGLADRVAARFGPVALLRHGASIAALGLTAVALSPGWTPPGCDQ